ncbi:MAG: DUF3492 domain-containing protein [Geobacter sp.]|nr:DUF3492 domain-containing protein [Geobacter sp.]
MTERFPTAESVDIMLLLEGTFPYVSGGVSSWVNQMIRGFPEYRFGAVFLGSRAEDYSGLKYELPENLVHLEAWYLQGGQQQPRIEPQKGNPPAFSAMRQLHDWFRSGGEKLFDHRLLQPDYFLDRDAGVDFAQFLYSEQSWQMITDLYREHCSDPSFVDFFWTVRNMHAPIWQMASIAAGMIPARIYHTVSTGYAGFLGALLHQRTGRPLLLSEHGIYTKERRIDIFHSDWIRDNRNAFQRDPSEVSYFRELWIRFFETMGRLCYESSDLIVSLYEGARERQILDGAPEEKTRVIPNGVDIEHYAPLRSRRSDTAPPILCLVGRVVQIKDVKTFIRSIRIMANHLPNVEGWIVGPVEEDPTYFDECTALAESLAVTDRITFRGFMDPVDVYPSAGLLLLSSISEGLPLVVLEAFAAGLPAVTTDVGACRQLVFGSGGGGDSFGAAGEVVEINNPQALADAALRLLSDPAAWQGAQSAAIGRVEHDYSRDLMLSRYGAIFRERVS